MTKKPLTRRKLLAAAAPDDVRGIAALNVARVALAAGLRLAVERELPYERNRREWSGGSEQLAASERFFSHS